MALSTSPDVLMNKYCNELSSNNKTERKRTLVNVKALLCCSKNSDNESVITSFELVLKHLIRCFKDNSEAVRETAVVIVTETLRTIPAKELYINTILPVISERLGCDPVQENSEEVRLCMVILLTEFIKNYTDFLFHYLNDFVNVFVKTIVDPYPKVKKESCDSVAELAKSIPQHFHMQSESVIPSLIQTLGHQQYRIRVAAISSIGFVIRYGNNRSVNDVCGPLAERLFDQHHSVRAEVAKVVGMWLLELPDRYSYFHKLIPLMLTSLSEEMLEYRKEAEDLWMKVGQQYMLENETELKEKMDYLEETLDHYPPNVNRPNLGCRTLVQRELSKYLPAIALELDDWKEDIRVKSAQLMCITVQHAEAHITQHLEKTLQVLYKATLDKDPRVSENIVYAAQMLGYFVSPEVYWQLMRPSVQESTSPGPLQILAAVISTSKSHELKEHLLEIGDTLADETLCYNIKSEYQRQLLSVVSSLIEVMDQGVYIIVRQLFTVCLSVMGLSTEPAISKKADELLRRLGGVTEMSMQTIFEAHTPSVLDRVVAGIPQWSLHSPYRYVFEALLTNAGSAVGKNVETVLRVLEVGLGPQMEPVAVLHMLAALNYVLTHSDVTLAAVPNLTDLAYKLCTGVLYKQLVWRAGLSAEALRTAALGCVVAVLDIAPCSRKLADVLTPLLLGLLEDSDYKSRTYATLSLLSIVRALKTTEDLKANDIDTIFPLVMKRLDDCSDKVRDTAVRLLCELFLQPLPSDFSIESHNLSLQALYDTMLLHLDDPGLAFQTTMLNALKEISSLHPQLLKSRIKQENFRNKKVCEELIEFLSNLKL